MDTIELQQEVKMLRADRLRLLADLKAACQDVEKAEARIADMGAEMSSLRRNNEKLAAQNFERPNKLISFFDLDEYEVVIRPTTAHINWNTGVKLEIAGETMKLGALVERYNMIAEAMASDEE